MPASVGSCCEWVPLAFAVIFHVWEDRVHVCTPAEDLTVLRLGEFTQESQTPLMKAAMSGKGDAARLLLQAGADVSITDKEVAAKWISHSKR